MFSKDKDSKPEAKSKIGSVDTLIGATAQLKGDIVTEGNVRVDGTFEGNMSCKGEVLIGEGGIVTGDVKAQFMIVYGQMRGNIKSDGLVEIMPTGKVYGDIEVKSVSIKEGAIFEGKSMMQHAAPKPKVDNSVPQQDKKQSTEK